MAKTPPPEENRAKVEEKIAQASVNLELVKSVEAVHNIYYLAEIIYGIDRAISGAAKAMAAPIAPTQDSTIVSGRYCAVMCHDIIGVKAEPAEIKVGSSRKVPHAKHLEAGLSCRVCHDFGPHKQSGFRGPDVCLKCHGEDDLK
jgi:hypothetical protein